MPLTIFGRKVALDGVYGRDAKPEHRRFGAEVYVAVQELLDRGLIETYPVRVMPGGWEGVRNGVNLVCQQAHSGYKMVYVVT